MAYRRASLETFTYIHNSVFVYWGLTEKASSTVSGLSFRPKTNIEFVQIRKTHCGRTGVRKGEQIFRSALKPNQF